MGTSGSFGGSGGKDANDLRDSLSEWLDDGSAEGKPADSEQHDGPPGPLEDSPRLDLLRPTIRLLGRSGGGSGMGSGGGGSGSGAGSGRSSGGATRSVQRMSRAAGRAGGLASAYATGNRAALAEAGLNYDDLVALNDPLEVGTRIAKAALDSQSDGTIESGEEREIAAKLVAWIIDQPPSVVPTPDDIARKSIELIIAEVTLTEITDKLRSGVMDRQERSRTEQGVRDAAEVMASKAKLSTTGATQAEITHAIQQGIEVLVDIYGGSL